MLNSETIKKIEDFVYTKPRSIQEIAEHIKMNWRTADRYIEEIGKNFGTISTRIFRGGTRGALKIVYWSSIEKVSSSIFQEELEKGIINEKKKENFSAFDIYQHVSEKKKQVFAKKAEDENRAGGLTRFFKLLLNAKKQVIFLSGNLSFLNVKNKDESFFSVIEKLVKKGIKIKAICRVDLTGKENIENLLSLNFKYGKELIEIKHREQPLRATIIDNELVDLKEIIEPTGKVKELNKRVIVFYTIKDKEWVEWFTKIFWKMYNSSISAQTRLGEINKIFKD